MDRAMLADFLRRRRATLQPEDVGIERTPRRRTAGLRRDEVARLVGMSTDYYTRLEQGRGSQPSPSMLLAITRGLRLQVVERDHVFRLAGHIPPPASGRSDVVAAGVHRILDRVDTPAMITNDLGEVLAQNRTARALFGEESPLPPGDPARSRFVRWFCSPGAQDIHPAEERLTYSRAYVSLLRLARGRTPHDRRTLALIQYLHDESREFRELWESHQVVWRPSTHRKTFLHPRFGTMELDCEELSLSDGAQVLLVYTAPPDSVSQDRLDLLRVVA
ncbi:MAG: helix-turn-helix domain-containing protein [Actinobacteria bacterium]|nr:helix-turn-helix domain-containing protein [Actinomycetota bacterium]